jgi:hypothetical protein
MELDGARIGALAAAQDVLRLERHVRRCEALGAGGEEAELAPDHEPDDAVHARLRDPAAADETAIAQYRVAVADLEHFLEAVGDENRRYAMALEAADDGEELFHLGPAQGAGWLVHDDELRLHRQRAGDLDHLLLGNREVAHPRGGAAVEPDALAELPRLSLELPIADEEVPARLTADEDVLRHRHVGGEGEFLVDGDDTGALRLVRRGEAYTFAVELDGAAVGRLGAGKDLEQGRLAGAILAQKGMDFRKADLEVDVLECPHTGEGFRYSPHAQKRRFPDWCRHAAISPAPRPETMGAKFGTLHAALLASPSAMRSVGRVARVSATGGVPPQGRSLKQGISTPFRPIVEDFPAE